MRILALVLTVLLIAGCEPSQATHSVNELIIQNADGTEHVFNIELALTGPEIQKGLMNRPHLDENAGMLFVFRDEAERRFWMKNTLIPLDMIFIKADGVIHHIHHEAKPLDLTSVSSQGVVMAVLEINGGLAKNLGISKGSLVIHPFFEGRKAQ